MSNYFVPFINKKNQLIDYLVELFSVCYTLKMSSDVDEVRKSDFGLISDIGPDLVRFWV